MQHVFGVPIGALTVVLVTAMAVSVAVIAVIAVRQRVFFRMGVRNLRRRPARSALIVVGLMLGTAIICAALTTGDTMGRTVRRAVIETLGTTDEEITAKGVAPARGMLSAGPANVQWFPQSAAAVVQEAARRSKATDGVAPAVIESVAVQDRTSRQNEPRVNLFAIDPGAGALFADMRSVGGASTGDPSLGQLAPGQVFIDEGAASALDAKAGDEIVLLAGDRVIPAKVTAIVRVDGTGSAEASVLMPLAHAQAALGHPGQITHILVSNTGTAESGAALTDRVVSAIKPVLGGLGLEITPSKRDGLDFADTQANAFVTMFTTFGSFSMAAGVLLIFLVFVMLAAERRGEMGMARAVGTQRRHLIETFLFEGAVYDLVAAAVGALLGVGVAYAMVAVMARAFAAENFDIAFGVQPRSVLVAYGIGMLLTLSVVAVSAWKVSRLNIVSAIRDIPEDAVVRPRRRWVGAGIGLALGGLVTVSGIASQRSTTFNLGISILIASFVLVAIALGSSARLAYSIAGVAMVVWWLLPSGTIPAVDRMSADMSIWIVGGLAIVVGATWAMMYNADFFFGAAMRVVGRVRSLAPVLKMAMAYPLRTRFRTAVTLAMFMLVVFTMVTGSTIPGSVMAAVSDKASFGGGFDLRATTPPSMAIGDLATSLPAKLGPRATDYTSVASQSVVPVSVRQDSGTAGYVDYVVRGVDQNYTAQTTYPFSALARGYRSGRDVWSALARQPGLAVVDSLVAPRRDRLMVGGVLPDFAMTGFYVEDGVFDPVALTVRDPAGGSDIHLTVIGVLSDKTPYELTAGVWVSQNTLAPLGDRARPSIHFLKVKPGVDATAAAARLERAFLANGMQAESVQKILDRSVGSSLTFIRLIDGFMALGLLVGVASLGVISARSVVERRQQLGVLRAIGFQKHMIRRTLLLESSLIAVTAIVVGMILGLIMSRNVIADMASQPGWSDLGLAVPWPTLALVFGVVYVAAVATTWIPAARASRIYPAEALRYG